MNRKQFSLALLLLLVFTLAACSPTPKPADIEKPLPQVTLETDQEGEGDAGTDNAIASEPAAIDPAVIFSKNCAACHSADRSGGRGPSLLPDRLTKEASQYAETITNGSGPMPAWGNRLSAEEIKALSEWILTPAD